MSAADAIKQELRTVAGFDTTQAWAERVLAALKRAGYAVVELPEPIRSHPRDSWPVVFAGEIEGVYPMANGDVVISGVDTMSSIEARNLAAALLAAADAAERVS